MRSVKIYIMDEVREKLRKILTPPPSNTSIGRALKPRIWKAKIRPKRGPKRDTCGEEELVQVVVYYPRYKKHFLLTGEGHFYYNINIFFKEIEEVTENYHDTFNQTYPLTIMEFVEEYCGYDKQGEEKHPGWKENFWGV
jgi:hypothetical protein